MKAVLFELDLKLNNELKKYLNNNFSNFAVTNEPNEFKKNIQDCNFVFVVHNSNLAELESIFNDYNIKLDESHGAVLFTQNLNNETEFKAIEMGFSDVILNTLPMQWIMKKAAFIKSKIDLNHTREVIAQIILDERRGLAIVKDRQINLTQTEFKILDYLLAEKSQVALRIELQKTVLGYEDKSNRCLDVHIHNLRKKLRGVGFTVEAVRSIGVCLKKADII